MNIQSNITIFTGDTQSRSQAERAGADRNTQDSKGKSATFYAGNLLTEFPLRDRLQQRRAQAQERAMKIVGDTWDGDRMIDGQIQESRDRLRELRSTYKDAQDSIRALEAKSDEWAAYYEVDPDSQEQQDLELLKKEQASQQPWTGVQLTREEEAELAAIKDKGITEYQKVQLEVNDEALIHQKTAFFTGRNIEKENAVIRGIRLERLKRDPMVKARKEADQVMEAARDEAIGMIVEEAKEHIDQEQEKKEEEAEAIEEKKEEQEEVLEKRREDEEELEELMKDMPLEEMSDLKNAQTEIQQEIQNLVSKMNLVAEDIKGAKVDTNI